MFPKLSATSFGAQLSCDVASETPSKWTLCWGFIFGGVKVKNYHSKTHPFVFRIPNTFTALTSVNHIFKTLPDLTLVSLHHLNAIAEQEISKPPIYADMPGSIFDWSDLTGQISDTRRLWQAPLRSLEYKNLSDTNWPRPRGVLSPATRAPDTSCGSGCVCWLVIIVAFLTPTVWGCWYIYIFF